VDEPGVRREHGSAFLYGLLRRRGRRADDVWKWNATLGGTGHGPDATTIVNLAVGGSWPGNVAVPSAYSADLDLYSIAYYGP
jgi:hypothetical protein